MTLGLVHGSQPDVMILCHRADRTMIAGVDGYRIPDWPTATSQYLSAARLTNPDARIGAISLDCESLSACERQDALMKIEVETGLYAFDPMATEFIEPLLAALAEASSAN